MTNPNVSVISVVGGECSGKTTLACELSDTLPGLYVPEALRIFVDREGRTPMQSEQRSIMRSQIDAEAAAVLEATDISVRWVISDPGALMTAVYSVVYFDDESLLTEAIEHHRNGALTVICQPDFPWRPDGSQRDGPAHQRTAQEILERVIDQAELPVLVATGTCANRVHQVEEWIQA